MTISGWAEIALTLALVVALAIPLSALIVRLYAGQPTFLSPALAPVEAAFFRLAGVDPRKEQSWLGYTLAMLVFSAAGFASLYALQRLQGYLPLNPRGFDGVPPDLAFNTSVSFLTNTNWQNYSGETTMSHLTQMLGLTVHNFVSAATGLAMAFALIRGFARSSAQTLGNFWVDMTRITLHLLLPLSIVFALALVALGIPQTLQGAVDATHARRRETESSPSARWRARRRSRNSARTAAASSTPMRRTRSRTPTPGPIFWRSAALLLIPVSSVLAFGRAVGDSAPGPRHPRGDGRAASSPASASLYCRRELRQSATQRARASIRPAATWKARRCASVRR